MYPFIKVFGLTLVNCAALCCGGLAFFGYFWWSNPLETVLPFAVFVLFCAFQPWLLGVCALYCLGDYYLPRSGFLILSSAFVLTLLSSLLTRRVYRTLCQRGKINGFLRYQSSIKAGTIVVLGSVMLVSYAGYKDFPKQNAALDTAQISPSFRFAEHDLQISATDAHFYVLPLVPNYQVLWQAHVPRAQMAHFETFSGMQRVSEKTFSSRFWDKPPYWWRRPKGEIQAYKDYGFSEDGLKDGGHSEAGIYDPQTETLFLWEQWIE